jgi:hypothetical protein
MSVLLEGKAGGGLEDPTRELHFLGSQGALRRSQLSSTAQRRTCSTSICLTLTFTQQHHDGPAERKRWPGVLV